MDRRKIALLVALAALLLAPAAFASKEEVVEKGAAPAPAEQRAEAKAADDDETSDEKKAEAAVHPSFNTVEEILALQGGVASLWTAKQESAPEVEWRESKPEKPEIN